MSAPARGVVSRLAGTLRGACASPEEQHGRDSDLFARLQRRRWQIILASTVLIVGFAMLRGPTALAATARQLAELAEQMPGASACFSVDTARRRSPYSTPSRFRLVTPPGRRLTPRFVRDPRAMFRMDGTRATGPGTG